MTALNWNLPAKTIRLVLPYPPSVNHYFVRRGRRVIVNKAGVVFRQEVILARRRQTEYLGVLFAAGELAITVEVNHPDRKERDLDNLLKALFDALTAADVWITDYQVAKLAVERSPRIVPGGQVAVEIQPFTRAKT
jgi:crossover junction endodeoxyribonuclease RusA